MGCVRWEEEKPSPEVIDKLNELFGKMEAELIKKYGYIGVGNDLEAVVECQAGVIYFYDSHDKKHFWGYYVDPDSNTITLVPLNPPIFSF